MPDEPGAEMQHDTAPHEVGAGGPTERLIASLLYLRYSKRRYLKFYRMFNRFRMKCFLHEALMFWGYLHAVHHRQHESGAFAGHGQECGDRAGDGNLRATVRLSRSVCHEVRPLPIAKPARNAAFGRWRPTSLPGRSFESLEDLNRQAFEWATVRMEHRPRARRA